MDVDKLIVESWVERAPQNCPKCGWSAARVILTPEHFHYARMDCQGCGKFIKWVAKPKNRQNRNGMASDIAIAKSEATGWELDFLESIESRIDSGKSLSPKQMGCLDRILEKMLDPRDREWRNDKNE